MAVSKIPKIVKISVQLLLPNQATYTVIFCSCIQEAGADINYDFIIKVPIKDLVIYI